MRQTMPMKNVFSCLPSFPGREPTQEASLCAQPAPYQGPSNLECTVVKEVGHSNTCCLHHKPLIFNLLIQVGIKKMNAL